MTENVLKNDISSVKPTSRPVYGRVYDFNVVESKMYSESKIDKILLEKLVDNLDILSDDIGVAFNAKTNTRMDKDGTITMLKEYFTKRKKNKMIMYAPISENPCGRHFSKETSLQGMPRVIRHLICKENYIDIDIKNAHPSILLQICNENNYDCSSLKYYIENRDDCLKELIQKTGQSKDSIKASILSIMNGGESHDLIQELIIKEQCPAWLINFKTQISKIHQQLTDCKNYNDIKNRVLRKSKERGLSYNLNGKVVNNIMCMYENIVIKHLEKFCERQGVVIASLQFDGLILEKNEIIDNVFLERASQFVLEKVGLKMEFCIKPMDEGETLRERVKCLKTKAKLKEEKAEEKRQEKRNKQIEKKEEQEVLPELSDLRLTHVFLNKKTDEIAYHRKLDKLYLYSTKSRLWEEITFEELTREFSDVFLEYLNILQENENLSETTRKRYEEFKVQSCSTKKLRDVLFQVRTNLKNKDNFIDTYFNQAVCLFPFQDKVFDFEKNEIRDREKEDYFTFTTDNIYNPDPDIKKIKEYIMEILKTERKEYVDCFLGLMAHCLTNDNSMKFIVCLIGLGDNGKSAFINLFTSILKGFSLGNAPKSLFSKGKNESTLTQDIETLVHKRLATVSEIDKDKEWNSTLLKGISGDDRDFQSRKSVNSGFNKITITSKLWLVLNQMRSDFQDKALEKRFLYINFPNKFVRCENKLKEIKALKNDFFSVLCNTAVKLVQDNFKVNIVKEMLEFKKQEIEESDIVCEFFTNVIDITNDKKDRIKPKDLYNLFWEYNNINNNEKMNKRDFLEVIKHEPYNFEKNNKDKLIKINGFWFCLGLKEKKSWRENEQQIERFKNRDNGEEDLNVSYASGFNPPE